MSFIKGIVWAFLVGVSSAHAAVAWGEPEAVVPDAPRAVWGTVNSIPPKPEEVAFDVSGLFFDKKEPEKVQEAEALPPWLENAVAVDDVPDGTPMIAVVIDDLGVNRKMTREVIALPAPLTASFLSYAPDLARQTQQASEAGHELLVHTPMEPMNKSVDPGRGALYAGMSEREIKARLEEMLNSFSGYVGINNHMGSRFTANAAGMRAVLSVVKERGLMFLDSLTSGRSVAKDIAKAEKIPYAVRNVFLDNTQKESEIMKQLALLERQASAHGFAVGIGHPHKATVDALKKWMPKASEKGFVFVPISLIAVYMQEAHPETGKVLNKHDEWE